MKLCNELCIPCCDYCTNVIKSPVMHNGKQVGAEPTDCKLHSDEKHKRLVRSCGYCNDFHCKCAKDPTSESEVVI